MRKIVFPFTLLVSAFILPLAAHADTFDDFLLTGNGLHITFSLPASPPGNRRTCPMGIITACLPGSETDFTASAIVTTNGVSQLEFLDFPTLRFLGGLDIGATRFYSGEAIYAPNAATPTFLLGNFDVDTRNTGFPPLLDYTLTITQETTTAPTPEPSTLVLFGTGVLGLIGLVRKKRAGVTL